MNTTNDPSRKEMIADALSQLANVSTFPHPEETNANESVSGRAYRQGWKTLEKVIDAMLGKGHCKGAYEKDVKRAYELIEFDTTRNGGEAP